MSWNKRSVGAAPPGLPPYAPQSFTPPAAGGAAWQTAAPAPAYAPGQGYGAQFAQPAYAPPQYYPPGTQPANNNSHGDDWAERWDWGWDGQAPAPPHHYSQQQHSQQQHQHSQLHQNQLQQHHLQQTQLHQNHLQQQHIQQHHLQQNQLQHHQPPEHQNVYNNANVIEDSFSANDTWNWNMGGATAEVSPSTQIAVAGSDSSALQVPTPAQDPDSAPVLDATLTSEAAPAPAAESAPAPDPAPAPEGAALPASDDLAFDVSAPATQAEGPRAPGEAADAGRPPLALGRRFHPDTLTPQWSIESQMSQDSSDGPLTHSEGTYRSDELSRTSNKSSPGLSVEANFNYAQPEFDDPYPGADPPPLAQLRDAALDAELSAAARDLSLDPPPPARESSTPPRASPPPALFAPPPTALPPASTGQNPFKQTGPFSHRTATKPAGAFPTTRPPLPYGANLETAPDNSERPDGPAPVLARLSPPPADEPDNLEVAPSAERAHYLQAVPPAGDYGGPPPGLRRMVPGRGAGAELPGPPRRVPDGRPAPRPAAREQQAEGENLQDLPPPAPTTAPAATPRRDRDSDGRYSRGDREADGHYARGEREVTGHYARGERDADGLYSRGERDADGHYPRGARDADGHTSRGSRDADGHISRGSRDGSRRYPRDERPERGERRGERGTREPRDEREVSPAARRARRPPRSRRYDTEDTDYASDRERDRRRGREGSVWEGEERPRRRRDDERRRRHYRDIDPARHHRRTVVRFAAAAGAGDAAEEYSPSRAATDEDGGGAATGSLRRERRARRHDARPDPRLDPRHHSYMPDYSAYGAGVAGAGAVLTREQYEYYARLRVADPHAYLQLYRRLAEPYGGFTYDARPEDRASVHSGRSSANGLKGNETFGGFAYGGGVPRAAHSLADSDRELTTDVSLALAEGSARSDRFTPLHFATRHVKGVLSGVHLAVSGDARVTLLPLRSLLRPAADPAHHPPPPEHGVTHKKSVLDYVATQSARVRRGRGGERGGDAAGQALTWDYLALLLRQNGVVVGSDIAELLIKNVQEFEYECGPAGSPAPHDGSRRGSSAAARGELDSDAAPECTIPQAAICIPPEEGEAGVRLRELLLYGNRSDALECAMDNKLWGHALALSADLQAAAGGAAGAGAVAARFVRSLPVRDCARSLHAARLPRRHRLPVSWDESHGDWRPHAAILLANADETGGGGGAGGEERRALRHMAAFLAARGLHSSAQLCYLWGGEPWAPAPGAPWAAPAAGTAPRPRLWLLLGEPAAAGAKHVRSAAVRATAIYEYASRRTIPSLQVYKAVLALRMLDLGLAERAVAWARACVAPLPAAAARALLLLHRFLPPEDSAEAAEGWEGGEGSPSRRWLQQLQLCAEQTQAEYPEPQPPAPLAQAAPPATYAAPPADPPNNYFMPVESASQTPEQTQLYNPDSFGGPQQGYQPREEYIAPQYMQPGSDAQYLQPAGDAQYLQPGGDAQYAGGGGDPPAGDAAPAPDAARDYNDWAAPQYADNYWTGDASYAGYGEGAAEARPTITMPGGGGGGGSGGGGGGGGRVDDPDLPANHQQSDKLGGAAPAAAGKAGAEPARPDGKKAGWLGGILTKLSLRPPNQMILPDDKNPSIVWDEAQKCWRDVDGAPAGPAPGAVPPPPAARMPPPLGASSPLASPALAAHTAPGAPAANIFKMQKSRHIKKSYVDVLASSRAAPPAGLPPPPAAAAAPAQLAPNYFVPTDPAMLLLPPLRSRSPLPSPIASSTQLSEQLGGDQSALYHSGI